MYVCIAILNENLGSVILMAINESLSFTVETDANVAISATLNQRGKLVELFQEHCWPTKGNIQQ